MIIADFGYCLQHFLAGRILGHIAFGAEPEHLLRIGRLRMHGYPNDLGTGREFTDLLQHIKAAHRGHIDIQQHDVRSFVPRQFNGPFAVAALSNHVEILVLTQQKTPCFSNQSMIINDHNRYFLHNACFIQVELAKHY